MHMVINRVTFIVRLITSYKISDQYCTSDNLGYLKWLSVNHMQVVYIVIQL